MKGTVKAKALKPGEILSEQQFYTVKDTDGDRVVLKNDNGTEITVNKKYAEACLISANQYTETKKVNRTEAAALFQSCTGVAVTVNFNKQVKEADVVNEIMEAFDAKITLAAKRKNVASAVSRAIVGEERTMIGRHYGELTELGRVKFIDMEEDKAAGKDYDSRIRQVDPRTINWFIARGVKYEVK